MYTFLRTLINRTNPRIQIATRRYLTDTPRTNPVKQEMPNMPKGDTTQTINRPSGTTDVPHSNVNNSTSGGASDVAMNFRSKTSHDPNVMPGSQNRGYATQGSSGSGTTSGHSSSGTSGAGHSGTTSGPSGSFGTTGTSGSGTSGTTGGSQGTGTSGYGTSGSATGSSTGGATGSGSGSFGKTGTSGSSGAGAGSTSGGSHGTGSTSGTSSGSHGTGSTSGSSSGSHGTGSTSGSSGNTGKSGSTFGTGSTSSGTSGSTGGYGKTTTGAGTSSPRTTGSWWEENRGVIAGVAGVVTLLGAIWYYKDPRRSAEVHEITKEHKGKPQEVTTK